MVSRMNTPANSELHSSHSHRKLATVSTEPKIMALRLLTD